MIPSFSECEDGWVACSSSLCVPQKALCDGLDDCGDRSDETHEECRMYSSETTMPIQICFTCAKCLGRPLQKRSAMELRISPFKIFNELINILNTCTLYMGSVILNHYFSYTFRSSLILNHEGGPSLKLQVSKMLNFALNLVILHKGENSIR